MTFSMFTVIPLPGVWQEDLAGFILPLLPLAGVFVGGLWALLSRMLSLWAVHPAMAGALAALFPYAMTGFIHLDGFMDVCDAVLSRRPLEQRRAILKDPHVGAFGAIMLAGLFLLAFAGAWTMLDKGKNFWLLLPVSVTARCGCGIVLLSLPSISHTGYAHLFRANARRGTRPLLGCVAAVAGAAGYLMAGFTGLAAVAVTAVSFGLAVTWAYRSLQGVSGDVSGFGLVVAELCGLWAIGGGFAPFATRLGGG